MRTIETLPVLDFRTLSGEQLAKAGEIFEEFRELDLKPAYLADADANRALLDRRVVCDLLNFDEDTYFSVRRLAAKWCAEPSRTWRQEASEEYEVCGLDSHQHRLKRRRTAGHARRTSRHVILVASARPSKRKCHAY